jgi:acetyltransferase-like isoleucine patch superfamily enzyme
LFPDCGAKLTIGKYCSIAEGVTILLGGNHRTDWVTTYPFNAMFGAFSSIGGHPQSRGDVKIGNDVWIGLDALILSGVTIHDGAVVGARSVVTHDVEPYTVVAGNPARECRKRFSDKQIAELVAIRWWDMPFEELTVSVPLLLSNRIDEFISSVKAMRLQQDGSADEQS